jgi:hypothetical protein
VICQNYSTANSVIKKYDFPCIVTNGKKSIFVEEVNSIIEIYAGREDMSKIFLFVEISEYVKAHWAEAVHEAEERYSKEDVGSKDHIIKIKEYAQFRVVHGLVDIKGEWLSVYELQYALDLFAKLSASVDYFKILKLEHN